MASHDMTRHNINIFLVIVVVLYRFTFVSRFKSHLKPMSVLQTSLTLVRITPTKQEAFKEGPTYRSAGRFLRKMHPDHGRAARSDQLTGRATEERLPDYPPGRCPAETSPLHHRWSSQGSTDRR